VTEHPFSRLGRPVLAARPGRPEGGYRTSPLSLTSQCVTVIAVAGQSVSVAEPCSRSAAATSPNNEVANNKTVGMPDGLAGVPSLAEAFGGQPAFRRPAGVVTPQLRAGCITSVSILVRASADCTIGVPSLPALS
jgi:hypothetical protein